MNCPMCQHLIQSRQQKSTEPDVMFEICSRCGNIWIDFGARRPRLHRSVEAQVARWESLQHVLHPTQEQAG